VLDLKLQARLFLFAVTGDSFIRFDFLYGLTLVAIVLAAVGTKEMGVQGKDGSDIDTYCCCCLYASFSKSIDELKYVFLAENLTCLLYLTVPSASYTRDFVVQNRFNKYKKFDLLDTR